MSAQVPETYAKDDLRVHRNGLPVASHSQGEAEVLTGLPASVVLLVPPGVSGDREKLPALAPLRDSPWVHQSAMTHSC